MSTLEISQLLGNYGEFVGAIAVVLTVSILRNRACASGNVFATSWRGFWRTRSRVALGQVAPGPCAAIRAVELQGKYLKMFSTRFKNTTETLLGDVGETELVELLVPLLRHGRPEVLATLRAALDQDAL